MVKNTVLACIGGTMEKHMRANSKMDIKTVWEFSPKTEINMKESLKIVSFVGKRSNTVKMETGMKDNMKIGKDMAKACIILQTETSRKGLITGTKELLDLISS